MITSNLYSIYPDLVRDVSESTRKSLTLHDAIIQGWARQTLECWGNTHSSPHLGCILGGVEKFNNFLNKIKNPVEAALAGMQ